ncbi:MAG: hypothetical protein HDR72_03170 [Ruminococcaceae bacterium]|nr:hypothetical protein [Oscillospiraceae bacterium]
MNILSNAKRSVCIALIGIKSWLSNKRMLMLLLILAAVIADFCVEINSFAGSLGTPTNIFAILPQMYHAHFIRMNIQLGIVLMFSDAPFHREDSLNCVTRCGYRSWCVGQIIYIILSSAAYVGVIFLLTVIFSVPVLGFSADWGRTFTALARRTARGYTVSASIQEQFSALEAFLNTMALIFILSMIIGLLIFLLSSTVGKGSGVIAAAAVILLGAYPDYTQYVGYVIKISPCSLTELGRLRGTMGLPDITYAFTFLGITAAILAAADIFIYSNRKIRHYAYNTDI